MSDRSDRFASSFPRAAVRSRFQSRWIMEMHSVKASAPANMPSMVALAGT